jgi:excisionase family DNA binding protein
VSERLLTAAELADRLALSTSIVLDWFEAGRLPGFKLGRVVRFRESEVPTAAAELIDLDSSDPGLEVGVYAGHASTSRAVAQETDDLDDVAFVGELLASVLVELVDRIRVLQGEPHALIAPRVGHWLGLSWLLRIAVGSQRYRQCFPIPIEVAEACDEPRLAVAGDPVSHLEGLLGEP